MHKLIVADVESHMGGALAAGTGLFKEDQVAGLKLTHGDGSAVVQLICGGAVEGVAKLAVHIAGEAGAVKAAGGAAAVHIGIAHKLQGVIGNFLPEAGLGGLSLIHQHHVLRTDIAVLNLIPAALRLPQNFHNLAGSQTADPVAFGVGLGADVEGAGCHLAVGGLSHGLGGGLGRHGGGRGVGGDGGDGVQRVIQNQVIAGDIAGKVLVADLVPAIGGGDDVDLGAVRQLVQHSAAGVCLRADTQRTAAGVDGAGDGQSGDDTGADQQKTGSESNGSLVSEVHG